MVGWACVRTRRPGGAGQRIIVHARARNSRVRHIRAPVQVPRPPSSSSVDPSVASSRLPTAARRALGLLLIGAAYFPAHRLLDPTRAGPPAVATRDVGEGLWQLVLWGTVLAGALAALLARFAAAFPLREIGRA